MFFYIYVAGHVFRFLCTTDEDEHAARIQVLLLLLLAVIVYVTQPVELVQWLLFNDMVTVQVLFILGE